MANIIFPREIPTLEQIKEKLGPKFTIYDMVTTFVPQGWEALFKDANEELYNISNLIEEEISKGYRIVPDKENIMRVFYEMDPRNVSVCIIGMDPYPSLQKNGSGKPIAQGLSFSVEKTDEVPPSLSNIYKEIYAEYPETPLERIPKHGDLMNWVNQGVMLLNVCLTCRLGASNSHAKYKLWHPFLDKFFRFMANINKELIFVMWGNDAQKMQFHISKFFKNMLMGGHPSPLAAYRGFFGCGHFKQINDMLEVQKRRQIVWM
jgi:uracil-DNA glycosylase